MTEEEKPVNWPFLIGLGVWIVFALYVLCMVL